MLFNSYIFILLFLPISVLGYFLINKTGKYNLSDLFLIAMSLWFYGFYNIKYLPIICISVVANFFISKLIIRSNSDKVKKAILSLGILANALSIFYFKYFDFFLSNINRAFNTSFELKNIVLPLGISFFTFQQISYLVDSYRNQTNEYGFIEYALFVVYFPQLIAGPIVLHKETIPQFRDKNNRRFNIDNFSKGLYIFSIGLFKKVIIADTFSGAVEWGFGRGFDIMTFAEAVIVSLCYTFQIYFDFSGYCDMAVGIGYMFNIKLPQNFNSPYKATSIIDFWSRWHMSLTRFLREYIYFPLGGSKKGKLRTYANIMIVFFVSGIWHGASWTFITWGLLHGMLNCLTRLCSKIWDKMHRVTQWLITFSLVNVLWVVFRAESITRAVTFIRKMLIPSVSSLSDDLGYCFSRKMPELALFEKSYIVQSIMPYFNHIWLWLFVLGAFFIVLNLKNVSELKFKYTFLQGITTIVFIVWSIMSLEGVSEFLYFNF